MLPPMKIDFTAPVGPRKFLRARREELAAMRFVRIGVEQMGATLGAEITEVDLWRLIPEGQLADRRAGQTGGRAKCKNPHCSVYDPPPRTTPLRVAVSSGVGGRTTPTPVGLPFR